MGKLITNIEELPIEWQKNICRGLRHQIVVPAFNIRHEHPSEFPSYLDREIANANAKMLELIEKSSWQGYDLQAISQAYVWNKERKKVLEKMKKKYPATRKKKAANFTDIIQYPDKQKLLDRLHYLIDGRQGADVGSVLLRAKQLNYLTRNPTKAEFLSEFELIGSWQGITNYLDENDFQVLERANRIIIFENY